MDYVGIALHKKDSQICILSEGSQLSECRIRTEPQRFAEVLGARPRARILLEASTESEWVARCLEGLGHEVVVADPNFAPMYATRTRKVKTDRRDARALAEACLLGAYRPAHRLSDAQRHVRGRLAVRDALVRTRTRYLALIRALLRRHGWRVPTGSAETFSRRVMALRLPGRLLSEVAPLLAVMRHVNQQLAATGLLGRGDRGRHAPRRARAAAADRPQCGASDGGGLRGHHR
jgi:transposase